MIRKINMQGLIFNLQQRQTDFWLYNNYLCKYRKITEITKIYGDNIRWETNNIFKACRIKLKYPNYESKQKLEKLNITTLIFYGVAKKENMWNAEEAPSAKTGSYEGNDALWENGDEYKLGNLKLANLCPCQNWIYLGHISGCV